MKFIQFADYLSKLENLSSRNDMTALLAELIKSLQEDEVKDAIYLLQGRVAPLYLPIEFAFSDKMIVRALARYTNKSDLEVNTALQKAGDIGTVVDLLITNNQTSYDISQVVSKLQQIAGVSGKNSQTFKEQFYLEMIGGSSNDEIKFINRVLTGNLRLGLSTKTIFDAISWSLVGDKSLRDKIERAYGVRTDLGSIAEYIFKNGIDSLDGLNVQPGTPVAPKLVEREKNVATIFARIPDAIIQPKLDGLRIHIHYNKLGFARNEIVTEMTLFSRGNNDLEQVRLFSRNLESLTNMFPEIVADIKKFNVDSLIIDGEAIGIDRDTGAFLAFQETIKRKRKTNIDSMQDSHPIKVFAFDILELNGRDLLHETTSERLQILQKILEESGSDKILFTQSQRVYSAKEIEDLFQKYVAEGYEGIIIKQPDSFYLPGTRNYDWIKLKAASVAGLADTIEGVVLGYYYGAGVRTKFGIGALLMGSYDSEHDRFVSLAKVGTGFKDADWPIIKDRLDSLRVTSLPSNVKVLDSLLPDVLVRPEVVIEVQADMVTRSKMHGGMDGYSLRFPRLKFFGRDKKAEDCTSISEIKHLFELQNN